MKAKTKISLITVLNAILCVVFAFIAGITYCASGVTRNESNLYSTTAYASNNNYKIINSTTENPILFGETTNNVKIAVDYSVYYNFDVRVEYEMSWSNGESVENVVLCFAGRDRFIVDDQYIYLTDKISKGSGTLNIINGVEFVNPTDEKYVGATLTITTTVQVAKEATVDYDAEETPKSNHTLFVDTIAGRAWAKLRSETIKNQTNADIIVYNSRYNTDLGITHPEAQTAYKDSTRLYGNRYYAGAGMYVMTGNAATTITVKSLGTWDFVGEYEYKPNENPDFNANRYYALDGSNYVLLTEKPSDWETNYNKYYYQYAPAAFDNNIFYSFNQDAGWGTITYNENNATSSITIAANKTVYIPIFDSMEITSVMNAASGLIVDYTDYRLVSNFSLNNTTISGKITEMINVTSSNAANAGTQRTNNYTILNSSLYNPGLYDVSANREHKYFVNVNLTNNTNETKTFTVSLSTRYTQSNGAFNIDSETSGPLSTLESTSWARVSNNYGSASSVIIKVAPYSTVSVANTQIVAQSLVSSLNSYDAWIDYAITVSETGSATNENSISVESTLDNGSMKYYIRNNSDKTVAVAAGTLEVNCWTYSYSADQSTEKPANWDTNYWNYYYVSNNKYVQATSKTEWQANKFFTREMVSITKSLTIPAQTLVPNASALIGTIAQQQTVSSVPRTMDRFVNNCSISAPSTTDTVGIVNAGTSSAYLVNASDKSYYVRFTGTCTDLTNVVKDGSYNYYIGIIRPGQIIDMPMSETGVVNNVIEATGSYSSSTLNGWGLSSSSQVLSSFETFFA